MGFEIVAIRILTLVHVKHCSVQVGLVQAQNIELENSDKEQSDLEIKQLKYIT